MILGYNTNGWANHDLLQAIDVMAELGYRSVAITIDHGSLNPFDSRTNEQVAAVRDRLQRYAMRSVIETGARFLLDPRHKHEPTLVSPRHEDRQRRVAFLLRAVDLAQQLKSDCVSLWAGVPIDSASSAELQDRLAFGLRQVLDHACDCNVTIGFEPEPGMVIDTMASFDALLQWIDAPHLQLTLDVGHLHCQREWPLEDFIRTWGGRLVNVHLEDMRAGVHDHLPFGEGEIDFPAVFQALQDVRYRHGVHVELSRHSHMAPTMARHARDFLSRWFPASLPDGESK